MTIATCILAVAAYFLYKARERKARKARDNGTAPAIVEMQEEPHMLVAPQGSIPVAALGQGQGAYNADQRYLAAAPQQPADGYYSQQRYEEQPYAYAQQPNSNAQYQQSSAAPGGFDYDDRPQRHQQSERSWSNTEANDQPDQRQQDRPRQQSGSMFYEYTNDGFIPVDAQQQRRQALPPAPPPVPTSSSAEAAQHYASRQQAEADGAQQFAYEQRAEAEQAQRQAAQMQQQDQRKDDNRQQEDGFAWL